MPSKYFIEEITSTVVVIIVPLSVNCFIITLILSCIKGPFQHPSFMEVTDGWRSFSALFLSNLLSSAVNIPNYKTQDTLKIMWYPQLGAVAPYHGF